MGAKLQSEMFQGIVPVLDTALLPDNAAQVAENCDLRSGKPVPLKGLTSVQSVAAGTKTIYKYRSGSGATPEWLAFPDDVDIVPSPVILDTYKRIFYSGNSDGKLHQRGVDGATTFDRAVGITPPSTAVSITATELFAAASMTCEAYFHQSTGPDVFVSVPCVLSQFREIGSTLFWDFEMPAHSFVSVGFTPTMYFRIRHPAIAAHAYLSVSNLGTDYTMTDSTPSPAVNYATLKLVAISGATGWDSSSGAWTYNSRPCTVQFNILDNRFAMLQDYYYFQSFVNDLGQEGPISSISNVVRRGWSQRATLAGLAAPTAGEHVVYRRIYRSLTGDGTAGFQLVAEIAHATSTYYDWVSVLGGAYEARENPPANLKGLVAHPAKFCAAFVDNVVYCSTPYLPHSWPAAYKYGIDAPVVGLAVQGNDIVVLTTGTPTILSGNNPASLRQYKVPLQQSCVAKKGICKVGDIIAYPSPDGMVFFSNGEGRVITGNIHPAQWSSYTPSAMVAVQFDGQIWASMTGLNLVITPGADLNTLGTFTESFTIATTDDFDDTMYILNTTNNTIYSFNTDAAAPYRLRWRCKEHDFNTPVVFNRCRVIAESYETLVPADYIQLLVYVRGALYKTMTILSEQVYNLPQRRKDEAWSYEVRSKRKILRIELGQSIGDFINA